MSVTVLDCTLRDGAYVVDYKFEKERIANIIQELQSAGVNIIECGWLRECEHSKDFVRYKNPLDLNEYLIGIKKSKFALMFDYGKYNTKELQLKNDSLTDIIRIAFYKQSLDEISFEVENIQSKGYQVFLQPSNTIDYTEKEINKLISRANYLGVDSLYIVDSFGSMYPSDLSRFCAIFDENLSDNITLGFHSHNNIQLSFALSIQFLDSISRHNINVDSSLCGIGRGAGNTKTELLLEYLNKLGASYNLEHIWRCIDNNIAPLYSEYNWEYTPQRARRGILGLHPNVDLP